MATLRPDVLVPIFPFLTPTRRILAASSARSMGFCPTGRSYGPSTPRGLLGMASALTSAISECYAVRRLSTNASR